MLDALGDLLRRPMAEREARRFQASAPELPDEDSLAQARAELADLLSPTPVLVDEILRLTGLPPGVLSMVLLELELAARLERHAGGRVSLV